MHVSKRRTFSKSRKSNCEDMNTKLCSAAREGRYDVVVDCIAQGADPRWRNGAGETGLHLAAWRGHVRVARLLLDSGWELEVSGSGGYQGTPLHCAAGRGRVAVISLLVERGADTDCRDPQLETPLHWAAERGKRAAVRRLLRLGADTTIENRHGETAGDLAEDEEIRTMLEEVN